MNLAAYLPISHGLSVQVHFPCTPAAALFIFWNAEYVPGPFAFAVTDRYYVVASIRC